MIKHTWLAAMAVASSPAFAQQQSSAVLVEQQNVTITEQEPIYREFRPTIITGLSNVARQHKPEPFKLECLAGCERNGSEN